MIRAFSFACAALCLAALVGCGNKGGKNNVPVSGKVTVDGDPVTSGQVSFLPFDQGAGPAEMTAGTIDPSGGYKVFTGGKEGAPPGRYKVTVTPSMVPQKDSNTMPMMPFDRTYADPSKTKLFVEVKADAPPSSYDLKLTKGKESEKQ
jgi:predicted small lipoprotein YifL